MSSIKDSFIKTSQHVAEATNHIVTPANIISVGGAAAALSGASSLDTWRGVVKTGVGFGADVLDGKLARFTGTSSDLGEKIDASLDKIKIGYFALRLWQQDDAPKGLLVAVAAQNSLNAGITIYDQARNEKQRVHPIRAGKYGTFAQNTGLGLHAVGHKLKETHPQAGQAVKKLGSVVGFSGVVLSTMASYKYVKQARSGKPRLKTKI